MDQQETERQQYFASVVLEEAAKEGRFPMNDIEAAFAHHVVYGDMVATHDMKHLVCALNACALHWPHPDRQEGAGR